jgi:ATP-dependent helicase/nuclease subunit B
VLDYKLSGEQLALPYVAHRLMLQLLTYLLVLEAHGEKLAGKKLTPVAALYVRMLRSIDSTKDPTAEPSPEEPAFHNKTRPRGLISDSFAERLDHETAGGASSEILAIKRRKDGTLAETGNDAVDETQFLSLVGFVRTAIVELADQVIAGDISVAPYLLGSETPCSTCPFPSVCRFDRLINRWRVLPKLTRKDALELINSTGGGDGH